MNKFDTAEFNPNNISLPSSDFFSFLSNEVYYIGALQNGECSSFLSINESEFTSESSEKTKFVFRWKETGYVLCDAGNPSMVLTVMFSNETGRYYIAAERYQNRTDQIWEVLPHTNRSNEIDGLNIRSASKFLNKNIYLSWNGHKLSAETESSDTTSVYLCPLSDWVNYGMACMQYLGWNHSTDSDISRALKNYFTNVFTNISVENALMHNGTGLIVNQHGGNFPRLNYADVYMNDVACEVIAVCNAIRIVSGDFDESNQDFFKLALEFELSGLYRNGFKKFIVNTGSALGIKKLSSISTRDGGWGSDPDRIASCLESHNIEFKMIHMKDQLTASRQNKSDEALKKACEEAESSKCGIISYRFSTLHQAIHTFAFANEDGGIQTFNRHCSHTPSGNYLNENAGNTERGKYSSIRDTLGNAERFYVGYFLS